MKRILLPLAAIAISLSACNTTPKYNIAGTVEGEQTGNVYLLKFEGKTADTLAKAAIVEGKFTMEGTVDSLVDAYLVVDGKRGRTPIFVENLQFTAALNPANPAETKVTGTPAQDLFNQFNAIAADMRKGVQELNKEYGVAMQAKDTAKISQLQQQYEEMQNAANAKEKELIAANPDSFITAYIVASKMGGLEIEELNTAYEALGANAKASVPGKRIADRIAVLNAVAIGQVAPDFTLETPDGTPLSMHSIKGKVKVLDFWASWCGPCRMENPNVVKTYAEYHPKGLEILSISLDNDKNAWVEAIEKDKLTWNHVSDLKGWDSAAGKLYGVNGIPHLVVLDENNVIVAKNLRGEKLKEKIAELLK